MNCKVSTKLLGGATLVMELPLDPKAIIKALSFFEDIPKNCPKCGGSDLRLFFKNPGEYEYFGISCAGGHECNFGERMSTKKLYYDPKKWTDWYKQETNSGGTPPPSEPREDLPPIDDDDIPF